MIPFLLDCWHHFQENWAIRRHEWTTRLAEDYTLPEPVVATAKKEWAK